MRRDGFANFLSVSGSLMSLDSEVRQLRLPRMNPFPKLDQRIVHASRNAAAAAGARPAAGRGALIIEGGRGTLPEVATDVIDVTAQYAVENVKRDRGGAHPGPRTGWGQWLGRVWGGHRAAQP